MSKESGKTEAQVVPAEDLKESSRKISELENDLSRNLDELNKARQLQAKLTKDLAEVSSSQIPWVRQRKTFSLFHRFPTRVAPKTQMN